MPKCPKCHQEINELVNIRKEITEYIVYFPKDGDKTPIWEQTDVLDEEDEYYKCPICGKKLFTDNASALAFLKGEETVKCS